MKYIKEIICASLLSTTFLSCTKDGDDFAAHKNVPEIKVMANIEQTRSGDTASKANFERNDIFGLSLSYDDFQTVATSNVGVQNNGISWVLSKTLKLDETQPKYDFSAIYPLPTSPDLTSVEYQSPNDFLFAQKSMTSEQIISNGGEVSLEFKHLMARLDISITYSGFASMPTVLTVKDYASSALVNAYTGDITKGEVASVDLDLSNTELQSYLSRIVVPQTINEFSVLIDGETYTYNGNIELVSGKNTLCAFTITKETKKITLSTVNVSGWGDIEDLGETTAILQWSGGVASDFGGGDGKQESPYQINTPEQLAYLAKAVNESSSTTFYKGKYFEITQDMSLLGHEWTPIGNSKTAAFAGNLDAGGHKIYNLTIAASDENISDVGMFGRLVNGANISNITLVNPQIGIPLTALKVEKVGGVAGFVSQKTNIINCHIDGGSITYKEIGEGGISSNSIGGIVGDVYNETVIIENCSVNKTTIIGTGAVGGICATSSMASKYIACWVDASLEGTTVAGILGSDKKGAIISACYTAGEYKGNGGTTAGIVVSQSGVATACYTLATRNSAELPIAKTIGMLSACYIGSELDTDLDAAKTAMNTAILNAGYSYIYINGDNNPFPLKF